MSIGQAAWRSAFFLCPLNISMQIAIAGSDPLGALDVAAAADVVDEVAVGGEIIGVRSAAQQQRIGDGILLWRPYRPLAMDVAAQTICIRLRAYWRSLGRPASC